VATLKEERDEFKGMYERSSEQVQQLEMEVESLSLKLTGLQGCNQGSESESLHRQLNAAGDREKALIDSKLGIEQDLGEVHSRLKKMKEENTMVRKEWDLSDAALKVRLRIYLYLYVYGE
jgi:chromosome segregation ATPase